MGCGSSYSLNYEVQYCSLDPVSGKDCSFKINLIGKEELPKKEGEKFINQLGQCNEPEIINFLNRSNFKENTIFYFYLGDQPLLKTFNQSTKYLPYNIPQLEKVFLLSKDSVNEYPIQIIENETKHFDKNEFVGKELNFNEIKKKLDEANNPNITKDSLSLKENSVIHEEESIKEKEGEIVLSEEFTSITFSNIVSRFESKKGGSNGNINIDLETSGENHNKNNNISNDIKSVKIFSSSFEDINVLEKIMNYLTEKNIKKFSFFENKINNDFEGWEAIFEFFEKNYSLRYIDLHSTNLSDYHLNSLTMALTDKRIRYLDLSENFLTIDGVETIATFLKSNKTLQKLNLCRNAQCQFKADGVKLITEALIANPNIELLDFSYMILTGCGDPIGKFISSNKSIEYINLRCVQLNFVDFKNIFVPLKTNKVMKEIDISLNDMGGDKSLEYIADAIKENKTLKSIKMDKININNDNYQIIFNAIEQNRTIKSYSVSYNSKLKPKIMLNFFLKQKQVKHLEYEPFDKENPEDKGKELTLEDKKLFEKFKTDRPDMEVIYK